MYQNESNSIMEILKPLHPSDQLKLMEKLSMKIRKENGLRIEAERIKTALKFPRIKS